MRRGKKILLAAVLAAAALILWCVSPGPGWLARQTALGYASRHAPEFRYAEVIRGTTEFRMLGPVSLRCPNWTIALRQSPEDGELVLRLGLSEGFFPVRVTQASWWTPEAGMETPDTPLPVPG